MNSHRVTDSFHPLQPLLPVAVDFGDVINAALVNSPKTGHGNVGVSSREYYDEAVQRWLSRIFSIDGKTVPIVMAPPMNAFAAYEEFLKGVKKPLDAEPCSKTEILQLLPLISVSVGPPSDRIGHNSTPIRNITYTDEPISKRAGRKYGVTYARYPKPLLYPYSIDIWCRYMTHLTFLQQRFEEAFSARMAHFRVETPFLNYRDSNGTPEGLVAGAKLTGRADNSELERGGAERLLRWTYTVEVEAWQFFDLLKAPTVHAATGESVDEAAGEVSPLTYTDLTGFAKTTQAPMEPATDGVTD